MKLTISAKSSIVRRIMQDLPQVDYEEQVRKLLMDDMIATAPALLVPVLKDKDLRACLITGHITTNIGNAYSSSAWGDSYPVYLGYLKSEALKEVLTPLIALATAQLKTTQEFEKKVTQALNGCTTRAAALRLYPQFEKYLPDEPTAASRALPVVQGLVDDLKKAGWPK